MKFTNNQNLPQSVVRAAADDRYSRGKADISVTSLIDAPRQHIMGQICVGDKAPVIDVSTRLWPLLGTAFHSLMDHDYEADVIKEERLFTECEGWTISGAIDRQIKRGRKHDIEDFKVTSVYTYMGAERGEKEGWSDQLNLYAELVEANGKEVKNLYIIALLRDWRPMEAKTRAGYPPTPIMRMKIEKKPKAERIAFMKERVELHQTAQASFDLHGEIVECTDDERWETPAQWALKRKGAKRALKLHDTERAIMADMASRPPVAGGYEIEERKGQNRRCEEYCDFAPMCLQWKAIQEEIVIEQVMKEIEQ